MENLIKALQIVLKYENPRYPTRCEHDILFLCVDEKKFSQEDIAEMDRLGFLVGDEGGFVSFHYGSC